MTIQEYNNTVDAHSDNLYRFFLKQISDSAVAQDLVQETFMKMWIKVRDVDYSKAKSYLFTVGYNCMIDYIRSKKRMDDYKSLNKPEETIDHDFSLKEALDLALDKLPTIQKTVILLRDYEGYNYDEIEKITGLNASQVKVYIFRARKTMKDILLENPKIFPV